jgi:hypothetical protein
MSRIATTGLLAIFLISPNASASYQMFCELRGKVASSPIQSTSLQFEFDVEEALDIEVDNLGPGNPDCHLFNGKRLDVILDLQDVGNAETIVEGAWLSLERFDIDVFDSESGAAFRSVKYVRKDD